MTPFVLVQLKWMTESTIHLTDSLGVIVLTVNGSGLAYTPWPDTKNSSRRIPSPLRSTTIFLSGWGVSVLPFFTLLNEAYMR